MEPKKVLTSAWMIFTFAGVFMYGFCQADRTWNQANDPRNLDPNYNFNFYQLPPSGDVTTTNTGWSDSYWPKTRGYILDRWQDELRW